VIRRVGIGIAAVATALALASPVAGAGTGTGVHRGDWEATGSGMARGSFAVVAVPKATSPSGMAVEDVTVDAPINCLNAPSSPAPTDVEVIGETMPISTSGNFSGGTIAKGNGTVVSGRLAHGIFELAYRHVSDSPNRFEGGVETCNTGTVHLHAQPGRRRAITDGLWLGKTQAGEVVEFYVAAGGRALVTPNRPIGGQTDYAFQVEPAAPGDNCTGSSNVGYGSGSATGASPGAGFEISNALFIDVPGTFTNSELQFGDSPGISGTFTSGTHADGSFSNPPEACTGPLYDWSAAPSSSR
jgi:hypothetical protein